MPFPEQASMPMPSAMEQETTSLPRAFRKQSPLWEDSLHTEPIHAPPSLLRSPPAAPPAACSAGWWSNWDGGLAQAWSIYMLELMCWAYLFSVVVYLLVLFIWSVVLWISVLFVFGAAAFCGICACCAEGLAGCADGCAGGCECGGGQCCECLWVGHAFHHGPVEAEMFYFGGTFPHDPFWVTMCGRFTSLSECQDWRSRVFDFLAGDASPVVEASHWPQTSPNDPQARLLNEYLEDGKQVLQIGLARAVLIRRPLNKGQDKCVQSSFEDYQQRLACIYCTFLLVFWHTRKPFL
eukprot:g15261.t1